MNRSFWCLILTQVQVLLNDNAAKLMLMALGAAVAPEFFHGSNDGAETYAKELKSVLAVIILLPFLIFAPTAGWISDRFSKRRVIIWTLWAQIFIMLLEVVAIFFHILPLAIVGLFLLGVQCAIFSPAKQGIIKEIVSATKISTAVGIVEVTAIASMLVGGLAGGWLYDQCSQLTWADTSPSGRVYENPLFKGALSSFPREAFVTISAQLHGPWAAGVATLLVLSLLAFISLLAGHQIKKTPAHTNEPFHSTLLWEHFMQLREVWTERSIRFSIFGISYFYGLAGALYLTLFEVSHAVYGNHPGTASLTGVYASTLGLGIICGSFLVTRLTTHQVEVGLIPIGSFGLIGGMLAAGVSHPLHINFKAALFGMGLAGALFVVPLNAYLQERVAPERRGRVLSANNLCVNMFGILAVLAQFCLTGFFHISPRHQLMLYAVPTACLTGYLIWATPEGLLRLALGLIGRTCYRVIPVGMENIPSSGGVLLVTNHISIMDALVLQLACTRTIHFVVDDRLYNSRLWHGALRLLGAIPINPRRARSAIEAASNALAFGEVVCLFPEGPLFRSGELGGLNRGMELILRKTQVPVVPVWLESVWGATFRRQRGNWFYLLNRLVPRRLWIHFGPAQNGPERNPASIRRSLYDLSEAALQNRSELRHSLGFQTLGSLRSRFFRPVVTDAFLQGKTLTGGELLAVGCSLSQWIKKNIPDSRVGLVLPAGLGATIANLALVLAGKVPVNLNFTAGKEANRSAIRRAEITTVITHPNVQERLKDFPWPGQTHSITGLLDLLSKQTKLYWLVAGFLLPPALLRHLLGLKLKGDQAEAVLLFTSGSSGEPKAVVLSHRNVLANTAQVSAALAETKIDSLLGCLPIFHSFGNTVTLWWPLLGGPRAITYPNPLDTGKLAETIDKYKIELLFTTPTFLRSFIRRAEKAQLQSLKMVVTGAEKLPLELLEEFQAKFGKEVCEGYGMTEATPVVAVNLPDQAASSSLTDRRIGRRVGSVGRLLPGLSAQIRDPESDAPLPLHSTGMLWLRGANIFNGYLLDPKETQAVLQNSWYKTGDLGRLDKDGFLYIEGRISRFSKVAGEMVPHGEIERKITIAFGGAPDGESLAHLVVGLPDAERGEALVLLTTHDLEQTAVRRALQEAGLPNLWIPRQVLHVDSIPLLATGKLDLRASVELARQGQGALLKATPLAT